MIDFSDFQIDTATIELRYDPALLLWDKSGAIWTEVLSYFPELRLQTAAPLQQVFESRQTRAVVELEAFRVISRGVDAEPLVVNVAQRMLQVCTDRLGISVFTRIGYREIRGRKFAESEEAVSTVSSLMPTAFDGKLLPGSRALAFTCGLRQEAETSGLSATVRTEDRELKLSFPWEVADRMASDLPKEHLLLLDSDYYTIGTTRREALNIEDWAKQASRVIKRYWKSVLE